MPNGSFPPMTITVSDLDDKGKFTIVKSDQGDFSIWEDKYSNLPALQVGKTVTVFVKETNKDGRTYRNIMGVQSGGATSPPPPPVQQQEFRPAPPRQETAPRFDMVEVDIRARALDMAVRREVAGKITAKQIEATADTFIAYITGKNTNVVQEPELDDFDEFKA